MELTPHPGCGFVRFVAAVTCGRRILPLAAAFRSSVFRRLRPAKRACGRATGLGSRPRSASPPTILL